MNEPMVQAVQDALRGALHQEEELEIDHRHKRNAIVHGIENLKLIVQNRE